MNFSKISNPVTTELFLVCFCILSDIIDKFCVVCTGQKVKNQRSTAKSRIFEARFHVIYLIHKIRVILSIRQIPLQCRSH